MKNEVWVQTPQKMYQICEMKHKIWLKKTSKQRGNKNKNNHQKYAKKCPRYFSSVKVRVLWRIQRIQMKERKRKIVIWNLKTKEIFYKNHVIPKTYPPPPHPPPRQKYHDQVLSILHEEQI